MIQKFEFKETEIKGLIEVTPFNADDIRGCFTKDYSKEVFEANGIKHDLAEVFYTTSYKGVIRALHFQREKQQPKLVRCIHGHVYDVVVDLRKDSPTFKKWLAFELIGEKHNEILVPAGCAHGYLVLEDSIVSVSYTHLDVYKRQDIFMIQEHLFDKSAPELTLKLVDELYPEYSKAAEEYMASKKYYAYNCFVMSKELFNRFCTFEFGVLFEFMKRFDLSKYQGTKMRTPGYMSEVLYGIFIYWVLKQRKYKVKENQLVFFRETNAAKCKVCLLYTSRCV